MWHLTPAGTARRIAGLPTDGLANGLAIDLSRGTLYAADSRRGTIWTVPSAGGEATAWLTDPALAPGPSASLGANGLRFHNGAVWVSNFSRGALLRIPIADSGAAERIQVVSSELDGIDDFSFLTGTSDVAIVALNTSHRIAVVYPNDTVRTILTASDGLASPTSTAVRDEQLYITDGGLVVHPTTRSCSARHSTSPPCSTTPAEGVILWAPPPSAWAGSEMACVGAGSGVRCQVSAAGWPAWVFCAGRADQLDRSCSAAWVAESGSALYMTRL